MMAVYSLSKINIERHIIALLDVSMKEQFEVQVIEAQYILRNRKHDLSLFYKKDNIREYNYTNYEFLDNGIEILSFKNIGINGQDVHPEFSGKYIKIIDSNTLHSNCETNLSEKVINALKLEYECSEIFIK